MSFFMDAFKCWFYDLIIVFYEFRIGCILFFLCHVALSIRTKYLYCLVAIFLFVPYDNANINCSARTHVFRFLWNLLFSVISSTSFNCLIVFFLIIYLITYFQKSLCSGFPGPVLEASNAGEAAIVSRALNLVSTGLLWLIGTRFRCHIFIWRQALCALVSMCGQLGFSHADLCSSTPLKKWNTLQ